MLVVSEVCAGGCATRRVGEGRTSGEGDDALTMRDVTRKGREEPTLLELVLRLHGDFRRRLEPLRVTSLQAGVLLFLCRHAEARVTDIAAALGVRLSTLSGVVTTLARKRWIGHTTITLTVLEIQTAGGSMEL